MPVDAKTGEKQAGTEVGKETRTEITVGTCVQTEAPVEEETTWTEISPTKAVRQREYRSETGLVSSPSRFLVLEAEDVAEDEEEEAEGVEKIVSEDEGDKEKINQKKGKEIEEGEMTEDEPVNGKQSDRGEEGKEEELIVNQNTHSKILVDRTCRDHLSQSIKRLVELQIKQKIK